MHQVQSEAAARGGLVQDQLVSDLERELVSEAQQPVASSAGNAFIARPPETTPVNVFLSIPPATATPVNTFLSIPPDVS
jgi:hypothetical protein